MIRNIIRPKTYLSIEFRADPSKAFDNKYTNSIETCKKGNQRVFHTEDAFPADFHLILTDPRLAVPWMQIYL